MAVNESVPALRRIQDDIIACERCPRLVAHRRRVADEKVRRFRDENYWGRPVPSFGDPLARLLIIGLAPAAHGANRTGRAFTGDRSGKWLYDALHSYRFANLPRSLHREDGLTLRDCFITQVVHCAPPGNRPERHEIINCQSFFLEELQHLRNVELIVPLGRLAFDACLRACRHLGHPLPKPLPRFEHGKWILLPKGYALLPSYHPSQQNTQTGRLTRDMFHQVFAAARMRLDHG
ncbi:MAG: uracil-DNA glycosylase [Candidatus Tectomicrobia bacterium]|nr:uracil-DNA glycosylase [Candidatus Tectomicrobia bacterium]